MKPTSRKSGFTLIELLVVVAIIAMLISILLPSLSRAREMAKGVACLSNQKQLGLGTLLYQNDSNNQFPIFRAAEATYGGNNIYWTARLAAIGGYVPNAKAFLCPSFNGANEWILQAWEAYQADSNTGAYHWTWANPHYAINYRNIGSAGRSSGDYSKAVAVGQIRQPTDTIVYVDAWVYERTYFDNLYSGYYGVTDNVRTSWMGMPHARHLEAVNITWADGHASPIKVEDPAEPWTTGLTQYSDTEPNYWDID